MSIALVITDRNTDSLVQALKNNQPDLNIQVWPHIKNPETVTFAVLWKQPKGLLKTFSNLKAVTSLGAGVDFIQNDPDLPKNISVHRIVTNGLKEQMAQYVLSYILDDFRQVKLYRQQQKSHTWKIHDLPVQTTIGFIGLGEIGGFVAKQCLQLGFHVMAYTQQSSHPTIICFHAEEGLKQVMQNSDYLVCLLPLNKKTKGILNSQRFSYCQKKPLLIQVGRGQQLVEKDLLWALDTSLIKHAVLDVFQKEPLPQEHEFWSRKDITITPHNAARSDIKQTTIKIVELLSQHEDSIKFAP